MRGLGRRGSSREGKQNKKKKARPAPFFLFFSFDPFRLLDFALFLTLA